jgi:hypothetical protein
MSLPVSLQDVLMAIEMSSDEVHSYLNPATREIVTFTDEEQREAESDEGPGPLSDLTDDMLAKVREVLESDKFLALPGSFEFDEWSLMKDFGDGLAKARHRDEVLQSIRGRGAFRTFKATIHRLGIQDDWYRFRDAAFERMAKDWLEANGVPYR